MNQSFFLVIGVLLFVLNMVFVGLNIHYGNYGLAALNFAAAIIVFYACIILTSSYRY